MIFIGSSTKRSSRSLLAITTASKSATRWAADGGLGDDIRQQTNPKVNLK
jgi:hypothetical protein